MAENGKNELNPRQALFVEGIVAGKSLVDAYMDAGYETQKKYAYRPASRLVRNSLVIAELDNRLFDQKRTAEQRLGSMVDGATNVYIKILKLDPNANDRLWELQRRVADDVFDRIGAKPADQLNVTGEVKHTVTFEDMIVHARRIKDDRKRQDERSGGTNDEGAESDLDDAGNV